MNTEASVEGLLQKAYDELNAKDVENARLLLEEALRVNFEHPEVVYALKCVNWWIERIHRLPDFREPYSQGEFLLSQWKVFYQFLDRVGAYYDRCQYALRHCIFAMALEDYEDIILREQDNLDPPELLLQVGRCFKGVGNYEQALKYLVQAARFQREQAGTIAEQADVNALMEEIIAAKVLFREAFFIDPQDVDLRDMESGMICRLADKVRELGYEGEELLEWIPIYGCLWGVFSVKRELKGIELGRIKQTIFTLENEIRTHPANEALLRPRLINRYFWLIDQYENIQEDPSLIEDTMLKIKIIDPGIYEQYRN